MSGGLLALHSTGLAKAYDWNPPFKAYYPVVVFFFLSNIFLLIMPLVPPALGRGPYEHLPYWVRVILFTVAKYAAHYGDSCTCSQASGSFPLAWFIGL